MRGQWHEASRCCERVIAIDPGHVEARYNHGAAQASLGQFQRAAEAFEHVVKLDPGFADAWAGLTDALIALGKTAEAEPSCRRLLELRPDAMVRFRLGRVLQQLGRPVEARVQFESAIAMDPAFADAHGHLGSVCADLGLWSDAIRAFNCVLDLDPRNLSALVNLAVALRANGHADEAAAVCRKALALHPDSALARYFVAMTGAERAPAQSPDEYVKVLFDNYAGRFEDHLVHTLRYRTPELIAATLAELPGGIPCNARALDLGCGTGLVGAALRGRIGHLTGVDLSSGMIEQTRKRGLYDELHVAEIGTFLATSASPWDLIIAADVFVYIGDLAGIIAAIGTRLRPGGSFAFSIERHEGPEPWVLRPSGRYAQSRAGIRALAGTAGLCEVRCVEHVVRVEAGTAIPGDLFVLKAPD